MIMFKRILNKLVKGRSSRLSTQKSALKKKPVEKDDASLVRNIGILAHIDAGKTTTTERMLFYSGVIQSMGEVHHGNTVTDFMDQERERGITITAASVSFPWEKHTINLLDTPGHIDFTMEVEQTLNVMDGAVVVLDATAGVEAQTVTVWKQAGRYKIPRIIYINKMDRPGAGFFQSVNSVEAKLKTKPVILQLPFFNEAKTFKGVIDLVNMNFCEWNDSSDGSLYSQRKLVEEDGKVWEGARIARSRLIETLVDLDDNFTELVIEKVDEEAVSPAEITNSVAKVTSSLAGVPILCGSSYKNIGVQLLMDAVVQYLPSPISNRTSIIFECFQNNLCARAFKIKHEQHKGPVAFLRIYSGSISKGQAVYNVRLRKVENCKNLLMAHADDYEELHSIGTGHIVAVTGLELVRVGDLLTSTSAVMSEAQRILQTKVQTKEFPDSVEDINEMFAVGAVIPDPVFFCSIEASSSKYQAQLEKALSELEREDPSIKVSTNRETGQTVLGGMGELHLDVVKERIRKEYRVDAETGPLQIAYKEELIKPARETHFVDHKIGNGVQSVKITMSVLPSKDTKELLLLDKSPTSIPNISAIFPKHLIAVKHGVESAVNCGPKLLYPVINAQVMLHWLDVGKGTKETIISGAASQCVRKLLKTAGTRLLEPLMFVEIVCPNDLMTLVLNDIGRRRAQIESTDMNENDRVLRALIPLSELLGYASDLRILTSGQASFTMQFHSYAPMSEEEERKAIKRVTGFDPL